MYLDFMPIVANFAGKLIYINSFFYAYLSYLPKMSHFFHEILQEFFHANQIIKENLGNLYGLEENCVTTMVILLASIYLRYYVL